MPHYNLDTKLKMLTLQTSFIFTISSGVRIFGGWPALLLSAVGKPEGKETK